MKQLHLMKHRAAYISSVSEFLQADAQAVLGALVQGQQGEVTATQRDAWIQQIQILRLSLPHHLQGTLCFEFVIPRIGKRADNILLIGDEIVILEFKVGALAYDLDAKRQVVDYGLDLKNFHLGSHHATITPVLVATNAPAVSQDYGQPYDGLYPAVLANAESLKVVLADVAARCEQGLDSHVNWLTSSYRPTPTIVEASQVLYRGHGVEGITHSEAGADNLGATTDAVMRAVEEAKEKKHEVICFVSGVPGAGKTLAGLNLVCQRRRSDSDDLEHAVFLSGNGPLVSVLQEALARDEVQQAKEQGQKATKNDAKRKAVSFIQNIHHFRDLYVKDAGSPPERVVVFDEAQRAWDREQASKFMRQKRGQSEFNASEPEFLIGVMDRHEDWAAVVCLIGGGQEINTGEAGLEEWLRALRDHFPAWKVFLPTQLEAIEYLPNFSVDELGCRVVRDPALHLNVSLRSFRSEKLSLAIKELMTGDVAAAARVLPEVLVNFPIFITRSIADAKAWVRDKARGNERYGLLASAGAKRLKPLGIHMDAQIDPCTWFLNGQSDVRSSYYLEDAASEFDVQGLELDWAMVVWDGDLIHQEGAWRCRSFKGTRWQEVRDANAWRYRINAYRVLLTRARQGMVIVVPEGDPGDPTRAAALYDPTWEFLKSVGLPLLRNS